MRYNPFTVFLLGAMLASIQENLMFILNVRVKFKIRWKLNVAILAGLFVDHPVVEHQHVKSVILINLLMLGEQVICIR
jgi:hypothetical protein